MLIEMVIWSFIMAIMSCCALIFGKPKECINIFFIFGGGMLGLITLEFLKVLCF